MWIIRFQNIKTKDYNYVKRVFEKIGFYPRGTSNIIFIKALFLHALEKKSWRGIGKILGIKNHLIFYNFYVKYINNEEIKKIFHYFGNRRIILFIGKTKSFTIYDLDNSDYFLKLTKSEIENIITKTF